MSPKISILILLTLVGASLCNQYTIEIAENKVSMEHHYEKLGNLVHRVRAGKSTFEIENLDETIANKFLKVSN